MKGSLIIALTFVISATAGAQVIAGLKAGANFPDLTGEDAVSSVHGKTGFYAGGSASIPVARHFYVQPELLWSNQGYKYEELGGEFKTTFNYIHLLVSAQYLSNGFCVETGPQLGFLLTAKREGSRFGSEDIKDSFTSIAFSWAAGVGYRLKSGLGVDLRYTLGIGSISSNANTDAKFNVLMFGISKTFNLAKKKK